MSDLSFIDKESVVLKSWEPMPNGKYIAIMTSSNLTNTKSGNGKKLDVKFTIFQEPYSGREIETSFNVQNSSPQAQEIGLGQLKRCALACGLPDIPDASEEMHDKPLLLKLEIETYDYINKSGNEATGAKNIIKGYYSKDNAYQGKTIPEKPKASAATFDDDSIPF